MALGPQGFLSLHGSTHRPLTHASSTGQSDRCVQPIVVQRTLGSPLEPAAQEQTPRCPRARQMAPGAQRVVWHGSTQRPSSQVSSHGQSYSVVQPGFGAGTVTHSLNGSPVRPGPHWHKTLARGRPFCTVQVAFSPQGLSRQRSVHFPSTQPSPELQSLSTEHPRPIGIHLSVCCVKPAGQLQTGLWLTTLHSCDGWHGWSC